jgi:hypothetical protein
MLANVQAEMLGKREGGGVADRDAEAAKMKMLQALRRTNHLVATCTHEVTKLSAGMREGFLWLGAPPDVALQPRVILQIRPSTPADKAPLVLLAQTLRGGLPGLPGQYTDDERLGIACEAATKRKLLDSAAHSAGVVWLSAVGLDWMFLIPKSDARAKLLGQCGFPPSDSPLIGVM